LTFGRAALLQGFDLVPVMIGLFGIGEVLSSLQEAAGPAITNRIGKLMPEPDEMRAGLAAAARATGISLILGLLPGMMPSIGSFLSYSAERYRSREPQRFGKGAIEGIASAEAANNATAMANLIPLLGLGIPTGPTMALMLAAFTMYGIVPPPTALHPAGEPRLGADRQLLRRERDPADPESSAGRVMGATLDDPLPDPRPSSWRSVRSAPIARAVACSMSGPARYSVCSAGS
jgi:Tripartite tricarboxylate transporter TctA family